MPTLRSGLVIAGAYADKIRRVAYAQLKDSIKEGLLKSSEVAYHVAQLNKVLYRVLVDELKIDKGDVVRISIDYEVRQGALEWKFDTLRVEAFRRIPDEEINKVLIRVKGEAQAIMEAAVAYNIERLVETEDGDVIYLMKLGDREVGAFIVTPVNNEIAFIKKGAAIEPSPMVVEKVRIDCAGRPLEEALKGGIDKLSSSARYVSYGEAARVIEFIKKRAGIEYKVERVEEEFEE